PLRAAVVAARAGVHRGDQQEVGREVDRGARACDRDASLLERLAQTLERLAPELRQLVEEQHTAVREADLARPRLGPAAEDARGAAAVVRGAKGSPGQRRAGGRVAVRRADLQDLEALLGLRRRQ